MKEIYLAILNSLFIYISLFQTHVVNGETDGSQDDSKIKLTDVKVITLYKDRLTTNRRLAAIPQLKCDGNYFRCQAYNPSVVQCYNKGYDGIDVQWECKANLDKAVKFGTLKVICEGFNYPDDPYILAGSCGLEYTLESSRNRNYDYYSNNNLYETSKLSNFLTLLIMVVIILAVYKTCNKNRENEIRREINSTYAHVIDGSDFNQYANTSSLFPPPPPPYGMVVNSSNLSSSASGAQNAQTQIQHSQSTQTPPHQPLNNAINGSNVINGAASGPASTQVGFKPESGTEALTLTHNQHGVSSSSSSSNAWGSFLAGTAVGGVAGYLLNRRNTSPNRVGDFTTETVRRCDSPPPAYEESRGESTLLATGFASTSRR